MSSSIQDITSLGVDGEIMIVEEIETNITGDKRRIYHPARHIKLMFYEKEAGYTMTKQGYQKIQSYRAYFDAKEDVKKNDKIKVRDKFYVVDNVTRHQFGVNFIYDTADLRLIEEE